MTDAATLGVAADGTPLTEPEPARPRGGLGRGAVTSLVLQGAGNVLQYGVQVVLARLLGAGQFGLYTYGLAWGRIAGSLGHLGGASSGMRFVPEYAASGQWALLRGVTRRFRLTALAVGAIVVGIGVPLLLARGAAGGSTIALGLAIAPVAALIEVDVALIRACKQVFRAFFPWLVLQPVVLLATVVVPVLLGHDVQAETALVATIVSYLACAALHETWLRASLPAEARAAAPQHATRSWTRVTAPIFASNVLQIVFTRLDVVLVGLLLTPRDAGIYAVAMKVGGLASILQTAMNATVAPRIAQLHWSGRKDELDRVLLTSIRWTFAPTLLLTGALALLSEHVLRLFGDGFVVGREVLILIALGELVSVSSGPVGWLMNLTGHERLATAVFAVTAVLTVVGYLALIPWLGVAGAALANGGAVAARNVALNVAARRRLGLHISVLRSIKERST